MERWSFDCIEAARGQRLQQVALLLRESPARLDLKYVPETAP